VTALKSDKTTLDNQMTQINDAKTNVVNQANQQIEQFTNMVGQKTQIQNQVLQNRLDYVNKVLMDLGMSPVNLDPVECKKMEKDQDPPGTGVYKIPDDMKGLFACQGKMLDTDGKVFSAAADATKDKYSDLAQSESDIKAAQLLLDQLPGQCQGAKNSKLLSSVYSSVDKCYMVARSCDGAGKDQLQNLMDTVRNAGTLSLSDDDQNTLDNLTSDLNSGAAVCSTSDKQTLVTQEKSARDAKDACRNQFMSQHSGSDTGWDSDPQCSDLKQQWETAKKSLEGYNSPDAAATACTGVYGSLNAKLKTALGTGSKPGSNGDSTSGSADQ
jgi:hypothetical protein